MASSSWLRVCSLEKIAQPPHCFLIRAAKRGLAVSVVACGRPRAPLHEAGRDSERGPMGLVGKAGEPGRLAEPSRGVVAVGLRFNRSDGPRTAACLVDAGWKQLVEARLADLFASHQEDLLHPRPDDLGEETSREGGDPVAANLPDFDLFRVVDRLGQGVAVVEL